MKIGSTCNHLEDSDTDADRELANFSQLGLFEKG